MPTDYISREEAIEALVNLTAYNSSADIRSLVESKYYYQNEWIGGIKDALEEIENIHAADRLKELTKAEEEERLVVLPCKVGGKLWVKDRDGKPRKMVLDAPDIRCHCAKEDNLCVALCDSPNAGVCAYRLKNDGTDFGKTVFLTREEAEKALEAHS